MGINLVCAAQMKTFHATSTILRPTAKICLPTPTDRLLRLAWRLRSFAMAASPPVTKPT